jgi:hypothetical protein
MQPELHFTLVWQTKPYRRHVAQLGFILLLVCTNAQTGGATNSAATEAVGRRDSAGASNKGALTYRDLSPANFAVMHSAVSAPRRCGRFTAST